jgi:hypothetical protein
MSATITWVIEWMQTTPTTATPPETVITAGWRCNGEQTANAVDYTSTVYSSASFPMPEGTFTPYDQLTQNQVLGWCWANGVDKDATEASLAANIAAQKAPVTATGVPW